jgi:hypothetical protein
VSKASTAATAAAVEVAAAAAAEDVAAAAVAVGLRFMFEKFTTLEKFEAMFSKK